MIQIHIEAENAQEIREAMLTLLGQTPSEAPVETTDQPDEEKAKTRKPRASKVAKPAEEPAPAAPVPQPVPAAPVPQPYAPPVQPPQPSYQPQPPAYPQPYMPQPQAPIRPPVSVPTQAPQYDIATLSNAARSLLDQNKADLQTLQNLLSQFGVAALDKLPPAQYPAYAAALRQMGAQV